MDVVKSINKKGDMKMKRVTKRSMLALLLVSVLFITACGGGGQPAAAPAQEQGQPVSSEAGTTVEAKVLKLGHIGAPGTAYDNFAVEFKEVLEEKRKAGTRWKSTLQDN